MAIKKRCIRCMKVLRADGTCQNEKCVRYKPEVTEDTATDSDNEENT